MLTNNKNKHEQQQKVLKQVNNIETHSFINLLASPELTAIIEESLPEFRQRLYNPTETLSMFLSQALSEDSSCQKVVNDYVLNKVVNESITVATSTGGYCKARKRLPLAMIINLVCQTGKLIEHHIPASWSWKNKSVPSVATQPTKPAFWSITGI